MRRYATQPRAWAGALAGVAVGAMLVAAVMLVVIGPAALWTPIITRLEVIL